ncbi:MAG: GxxExxY protein [Gemmatimonadaceae bacterium]|nr:GxxExxY protein [Gemmatimonadaceae bacterium]
MEIDTLTDLVIGEAIRVHRSLGPGLLESSYRQIMAEVLVRRGCEVQTELALDLAFEGIIIPRAYRVDLLIDGVLVVEVKQTERIAPVHRQQLLTYLRLLDLPRGLLLNFGLGTMKDGIARVSNPRVQDMKDLRVDRARV